MAKIVRHPLFTFLEEISGRKRPMVKFKDDDSIVHAPMEMIIGGHHMWGWYLNMGEGVSCVVVNPDGQMELHETGGIKDFLPGKYTLIYIDMHEHTALLSDIEARTKDAWRVRMTLDLIWQVRNPLRVVKMSDPSRMMFDRCVAAVVDFIQNTAYEDLIATPEKAPVSEARITNAILDRLNNNRSLNGFRFIALSLLNRQGDPDRDKIILDAMNQKEEIKRAKQLAEAKMERDHAEQQLTLQALKAQKESEKLAAMYDADIMKLLQPMYEQLIQLEQMSKSQEWNREGLIRAWEIVSQTTNQIALVLAQVHNAPGLQSGVDTQTTEALTKILKTLTQMLPNLPSGLPSEGGDEHRILPAVSVDHLGD